VREGCGEHADYSEEDMSAIQEVHQLKAQVKVFQQEAALLRLRVAQLEKERDELLERLVTVLERAIHGTH